MTASDLMAWSEALGVPPQDVHTVLRFREREVQGIKDEVIRTWAGLRESPHEELVLRLGIAGRVLAEVADELAQVAAEARREVG